MIADGVARSNLKKNQVGGPTTRRGIHNRHDASASLDAGTTAFKVSALTKVAARACPFHCTRAPETNPTPLMVIVRPCAPGVALAGTSGWPINGTGFEIAGWDCELRTTEGRVTAMPSSRQLRLGYFIG